MKKIIFVSPHYDDAVGSCGACINYLVKNKFHVVVVTIFGKGPEIHQKTSVFSKKLHTIWQIGFRQIGKVRKKENRLACDQLGCDAMDLNYKDCIYRTDTKGNLLYKTKEQVFSNINKKEVNLPLGLMSHLSALEGDVYFFPMALGNHIDHNVCFEAGNLLEKFTFKNVYYYKDFHYTFKKKIKKKIKGKISFELHFDKKHFLQKVNSFEKYQSQIPMLLGRDSTPLKYFSEYDRYDSNTSIEIFYQGKAINKKKKDYLFLKKLDETRAKS